MERKKSNSKTDSPGEQNETGYSTFQNEEDFYTVDDAIEKCGYGKFQLILHFWAGTAWLSDAVEVMLLSILGPTLVCEFQISTLAEAFLTVIVFTGFTVGSLLFGSFSDAYGRKLSLCLEAAWALYFEFLSSFSPTYGWIIILRFISGFALAGLPQCIIYYSEFLPNASRGKSIVCLGVQYALGGVLEVVLAMVIIPTLGWRPWLIVSTFPLIILLALGYWMPVSPRFDLARGRPDLAEKTLQRIADVNEVELPKGKLKAEEKLGQEERGQFKDLLAPKIRCTTLLLWLIWFGASFGYYGVIFMSTEIINDNVQCVTDAVGVLGTWEEPCYLVCKDLNLFDYVALIITTSAELPAMLLAGVLIDPIGRKKSMIIIFLLYTVSILLLFICVNRSYIIVLLFFIRAFGSSAFQVVYVYTPEVYDTKCRSIGLGVTTAFERFGSIVTPFIAILLISYSIPMGLLVYSLIGVLVTIACCCLPYETKGKDMGVLS